MKIKSQNENKCVDNSQNEMYHIITKSQNEKKGKEMRKYLKDARTKLGLSQNDVAKKLGISPNYYSCIESGDRQSDMKTSFLVDLSGILKIPISKMLAYEKDYREKEKESK